MTAKVVLGGAGLGDRAGLRAADAMRRRLLAPPFRLKLSLLACAGSAIVSGPAAAANFTVSDTAGLISAINNAANGDTIIFQRPITLTQNLPAITKNITITGGAGISLNGATQFQGFVVTSGAVAINNLQIANTLAQGGRGGDSYNVAFLDNKGGGGGGGAGLGGGLFVGASASVTLTNVSFTHDQAIGGSGGNALPTGVTNPPGGGGGGGMFGAGGISINGFGGGGGAGGGGNGGTAFTVAPQPGGFGGGAGGGAHDVNQLGQTGGFGGGGAVPATSAMERGNPPAKGGGAAAPATNR